MDLLLYMGVALTGLFLPFSAERCDRVKDLRFH